jgi:hypothetical protein
MCWHQLVLYLDAGRILVIQSEERQHVTVALCGMAVRKRSVGNGDGLGGASFAARRNQCT